MEHLKRKYIEDNTASKIEEVKEKYFSDNKKIRLSDLKIFEDSPFSLCNDEELNELINSIKDNGLLNPIIIWKNENNLFVLSGNNRIEALKRLGYKELNQDMYVIKKDINIFDARLIVVDANFSQRKIILPSERAKAYKLLKESLLQKKSERLQDYVNSPEEMDNNENKRTVYRYLRLNELIADLLDLVDKKILSINIAVEVSYLNEEIQKIVFNYFFKDKKSQLNTELVKKIRNRSEISNITYEILNDIVYNNKKTPRTFKLNYKDIKEASMQNFSSDKDIKDYILECIRYYVENNIKE